MIDGWIQYLQPFGRDAIQRGIVQYDDSIDVINQSFHRQYGIVGLDDDITRFIHRSGKDTVRL